MAPTHADRELNVLVSLAVALTLAACGSVDGRCAREPVGHVNAFFSPGDPNRDLIATVGSITPLPDLGAFRYDIGGGARLIWRAAEPIANVATDREYRFVVAYAPGSPDASGILVFERERLSFAAHTDTVLFQHTLHDGVPGFTITAGATDCGSRERTKCHSAILNIPLTFERDGSRVVLYQGERARLGAFEIHVLTAQQVTYDTTCADAGVPAVSFVIRRIV